MYVVSRDAEESPSLFLDILVNGRQRIQDSVLGHVDIAIHAGLGPYLTVVVNEGTACDSALCAQEDALADVGVVADLDKIVEDGAVTDVGGAGHAAVYAA